MAWRTVAPLALVSSSISSSRSVARRSAIAARIRERSSGVLPDQTPARTRAWRTRPRGRRARRSPWRRWRRSPRSRGCGSRSAGRSRPIGRRSASCGAATPTVDISRSPRWMWCLRCPTRPGRRRARGSSAGGRARAGASRATSSSACRSMPVATPISWNIETRSSVATLPVEPGGTGQPPSSPKLDSKLVMPTSCAASAFARPWPRVLWKCAVSSTPGSASRAAAKNGAHLTRVGHAGGVAEADLLRAGSASRLASPSTRSTATGPS